MVYHCLKRNGKCRYKFPKPIVEETSYCPDSESLNLERNNSQVNAFCPAITAIVRCNNDIQFLPGKGSPKVARYIAYYMSNYTSKTQTQTVNLLKYMVDKLDTYARFDPDKLSNTRGLFSSLLIKTLNTFVAGNEVGGPEVSSFLLGLDDHYTGFSFVPINWKEWDIWLCSGLESYHLHSYTRLGAENAWYDIVSQQCAAKDSTVPLDVQFQTRNTVMDYLHRPNELDEFCLFSFMSLYSVSYDTNNKDCIPFLLTHPQSQQGTEKIAGVFKLPEKKYPTLPWFNAESAVHGIGTEAFGRIMLLLFMPFRRPNDLLTNNTFIESYSTFRETINLHTEPYSFIWNLEFNSTVSKEAKLFDSMEGTIIEPNAFDEEIDDPRWIPIAYHLPDEQNSRNLSCMSSNFLENTIRLIKEQNVVGDISTGNQQHNQQQNAASFILLDQFNPENYKALKPVQSNGM
jgi:hypothetical protein